MFSRLSRFEEPIVQRCGLRPNQKVFAIFCPLFSGINQSRIQSSLRKSVSASLKPLCGASQDIHKCFLDRNIKDVADHSDLKCDMNSLLFLYKRLSPNPSCVQSPGGILWKVFVHSLRAISWGISRTALAKTMIHKLGVKSPVTCNFRIAGSKRCAKNTRQ